MVSWMISRAVVLLFGMLYPAYYSYKAVKTKNVKEYVRWMMYWIVFALYTVIETVADQTVAWFPLYYELKIAFVIWLLSPYTKGASLIYRKFLHPLLSSKEREIDDYIVQAKERGYETMVNFGRQGLNLAATAAVTAAVKSQGAITERLRSFSMHDLTTIQGDEPVGQRPYQTLPETKKKSKLASSESAGYGIPLRDGDEKTDEEADGPYSDDEMVAHKGLRRSQSMKSVKTVRGRKECFSVLEKEIHGTKIMSETDSLFRGKHSALLPTHQYSSLETLSLWSGFGPHASKKSITKRKRKKEKMATYSERCLQM
uniref:Receptor expression-enhancing protein n=1 Tax=Equus asinus TaxID=9793 RepID=A0A9L0I6B5_EQUAS